jgi:hypothetical protein
MKTTILAISAMIALAFLFVPLAAAASQDTLTTTNMQDRVYEKANLPPGWPWTDDHLYYHVGMGGQYLKSFMQFSNGTTYHIFFRDYGFRGTYMRADGPQP